MTQAEVLDLLKHGNGNVFITGEPGAGKSYVTEQYVEWLADNGVDHAMTASTGIAASDLLGGKTLHSFLGVRNDYALDDDDIEGILENPYTKDRLKYTDIILIDEISMVSASLLESMDALLRAANDGEKVFGGKRVIAIGDFFQLPPVKGRFAFESPVWKEAGFQFCMITEQHRQSEPEFTELLRGVRKGKLSEEQKDLVRARVMDDVSGIHATRLLETNRKVDDLNRLKLSRIDSFPKTYTMTQEGNEKAVMSLKKNCKSPEKLVLKVGAEVLFTQNDAEEGRFVNGTRGEVIALLEKEVVVQLPSGDIIKVGPHCWEAASGYGKRKTVYASICQIPLTLAWAITLHKSQGMTLESAIIGVSDLFACGQAYVGVSRVKTLSGLYLQGNLTSNFLKVDPKVIAFYESH